MNLTVFDIIDVAAITLAAALVMYRGTWQALGGPVTLAVYHLGARVVIYQMPEPVLTLGIAQLAISLAFLTYPMLSVYGVIAGVAFASMSLSSFLAHLLGWSVATGQGIGFDYWNFQSMMTHLVAIIVFMAVVRHDRIADHYRH